MAGASTLIFELIPCDTHLERGGNDPIPIGRSIVNSRSRFGRPTLTSSAILPNFTLRMGVRETGQPANGQKMIFSSANERNNPRLFHDF